MAQHILENENKVIQALKNKLQELHQLNALLAKHIDAEMLKHLRVFKFEKNCLFVMVANGHWTTQLRFRIPELIVQLQNYPPLKNLSGIICKTRPNPSTHSSGSSRRATLLTPESAQSILNVAQVIKDPKLRNILERIAGHTCSSNKKDSG